jgi:hypothetical protein
MAVDKPVRGEAMLKLKIHNEPVFFVSALLFFVSICGCSVLKEEVKGLAGISTKVLEDLRPNAIKNTFSCDKNVCYDKIKQTLISEGCYVYADNSAKGLIAVYVSRQDTTPVGIFLTPVDPATTKVEVSSPSTNAKECIASKIAAAFKSGSSQPDKPLTSS